MKAWEFEEGNQRGDRIIINSGLFHSKQANILNSFTRNTLWISSYEECIVTACRFARHILLNIKIIVKARISTYRFGQNYFLWIAVENSGATFQ